MSYVPAATLGDRGLDMQLYIAATSVAFDLPEPAAIKTFVAVL